MGAIWDAAGQVWTWDFWRRIFTKPLEAPLRDPLLAAKSGLAAGAVAAATLTAGPVVLSAARTIGAALFGVTRAAVGVGRAAVPAASFAVRHPIITYVALANAELPTEIVRAFGARPSVAPGGVPVPGGTAPRPVAPPAPSPSRPPVRYQDPFQAMFRS